MAGLNILPNHTTKGQMAAPTQAMTALQSRVRGSKRVQMQY